MSENYIWTEEDEKKAEILEKELFPTDQPFCKECRRKLAGIVFMFLISIILGVVLIDG